MGEPNNALAVYMNRPDRIRDLLEYYLGEKLPAGWSCKEIRGLYTVRNAKGKLSYRQRDFLADVCLWGIPFRLGLENQDSINLTFPWRLMELDCLAYGKEIEEIQEKNQASNNPYRAEDDFKYHYRRADRILPVLNLTLYWGNRKWSNPLRLREMTRDISTLPDKLQELAGDYQVHLVPMRGIPEEALQKMNSDLKYVLGIMKRTRSRKRYEAYILENQDFFTRIPKSAVDVIDACTNIKDIRDSLDFILNQETGEKEADMCKALTDLKKDAERRGIKQGIEQGTCRTNKLIELLLSDGRQDDLLRSARDTLFQKKLFQEYNI